MYRFFVEPGRLACDQVYIDGDDYNHIRNVLRMKIGEEILLCDEGDKEYLCQIMEYDTDNARVIVSIVDIFANARELPVQITLFQGYPKGDKLESIVQKSVELGVYEIVPVMMKRCVVKLDDKKAAKKVERLNAIALSAAKQSKRGAIPRVKEIMSFAEACDYANNMDMILLPYENAEGIDYARQIVASVRDKRHIGIFIGPEGGFDSKEVERIEDIGGKTITLGHRILRTETAGMVILSLLMFELEE